MRIVVCLFVEIVRAVPFQSSCGTSRKGEADRRTPVVGQQNDTIHAVHGTQSEKRGSIGSVVKQIDVFFVGQRAPASASAGLYRIVAPFMVSEILLCVSGRESWRTSSTPSE